MIRERLNELGKAREPFLFIIDFEQNKPIILKLKDIIQDDILYDFQGVRNYKAEKTSKPTGFFKKWPVERRSYDEGFSYVMQQLKYGNSYLLNLTYPARIDTSFSLQEIFRYSTAPYKLWVKDNFVVFSPETFIRIQGNTILSYPMKGTIDAGIPDAADIITHNIKEKAEHATIVDLIRNDMSIVAQKVVVNRFRYLETVNTHEKSLIQVSSEISGKLPINWHEQTGDILTAMLPAGSISGAPKKKTIEIIKKAEQYIRGYYTGIAGLYDGNGLESFVMIRYIEKNGAQLWFKSGGGITAFSNVADEYNELIDKIYLPFQFYEK